ncbi:VWA7 [Bugula neritina]|uniref:VWA7 n=1 Tax=Bugula neritina TaxID=10212 RepID=A0A7J7IW44_BUGNE|nr:VWA7 [Bugula neritina]
MCCTIQRPFMQCFSKHIIEVLTLQYCTLPYLYLVSTLYFLWIKLKNNNILIEVSTYRTNIMGMNSKAMCLAVACAALLVFLPAPVRCGISIGLIIDNTGSMGNDIAAVRIKSAELFAKAAAGNTYDHYVISLFNDPTTGPVFATEDANAARNFILNNITVTGGGDCPELAATGIIAGIEAAKPKSHLYFFSDASAKDGLTLGPTARRLALSTGCRVIPILTGTCGTTRKRRAVGQLASSGQSSGWRFRRATTDADHACVTGDIYDKLACVTGGEVYRVSKSEVAAIVDIIIEKAAANITDDGDRDLVLESIYNPVAGETNLHSFCVDPSVHDVVVSLIGPSAVLSLHDSTGSPLPSSAYVDIVNIGSVKVKKIVSPTAGTYSVSFSSSADHTLKISARSTLGITPSFLQGGMIEKTPSTEAKAIVYVEVSESSTAAVFNTLDMEGLDGTVFDTISLERVNSTHLVSSSAVPIPDDCFYIKVSNDGTSGGCSFTRSSPTAICPTNNPVPTTTTPSTTTTDDWSWLY